MRQSELFGKTLREAPRDEVSINAKLLERGGFVYKTMAGVYDYLPLGFRTLEKINMIIREEMNAIGGQELFLSVLQPKERWEKSGRWNTAREIMYQLKDNSGRDLGLGWTHEEPLAEIAIHSVQSYRDLPFYVYQIQTKFRDEPRAKSGLMRGREFLMKDLYSFHRDVNDLERYYWIVGSAYEKIFQRCGLEVYVTEASGGAFTTEYTHEYQVLSDAGEDWIFYCAECHQAQNKDISKLKEGDSCPQCRKGTVQLGKSIEVGNIFRLGTKFSDAFGLLYSDEDGQKHPVVMGSYGIGPGRAMAAIVETHADTRGILWPESVAPYCVHVIEIKSDGGKVHRAAEKTYKNFLAKGIEVLYDDRVEKTAGEKFADADLIGIPWRVVVSEKTLEKKKLEVKGRNSEKEEFLSEKDFIKKIAK